MIGVLLSGGMDSAVALHWSMWRYGSEHITSWSIDYGQKHRAKELLAAREIASGAGVVHRELKVSIPWAPINGDVIPGRNLILLSIVSAQLVSRGSGEPATVVIGACADDQTGFPDCRPEFFLSAQQAMTAGMGSSVSVVAPFITSSKAQIATEAKRLGDSAVSALAKSWSCYVGEQSPCGVCSACIKRERGLKEAGMGDLCRR